MMVSWIWIAIFGAAIVAAGAALVWGMQRSSEKFSEVLVGGNLYYEVRKNMPALATFYDFGDCFEIHGKLFCRKAF